MAYKFNPLSGRFDYYEAAITNRFVVNGNTLELWWNGEIVQSWTVVPTATYIKGEDDSFILGEDGGKIVEE